MKKKTPEPSKNFKIFKVPTMRFSALLMRLNKAAREWEHEASPHTAAAITCTPFGTTDANKIMNELYSLRKLAERFGMLVYFAEFWAVKENRDEIAEMLNVCESFLLSEVGANNPETCKILAKKAGAHLLAELKKITSFKDILRAVPYYIQLGRWRGQDIYDDCLEVLEAIENDREAKASKA